MCSYMAGLSALAITKGSIESTLAPIMDSGDSRLFLQTQTQQTEFFTGMATNIAIYCIHRKYVCAKN